MWYIPKDIWWLYHTLAYLFKEEFENVNDSCQGIKPIIFTNQDLIVNGIAISADLNNNNNLKIYYIYISMFKPILKGLIWSFFSLILQWSLVLMNAL